MKTVAIMQPYFLPHPPYFQLASACGQFVLCDNFQYTRKGWINRNRFLQNGKASPFTLPLEEASRSDFIADRTLAGNFDPQALLRRWRASYQRSPYFSEVEPVLREILLYSVRNLFAFLEHSIRTLLEFLDIRTTLTRTSELDASRTSAGEERVIAMCEELQASQYVNSIGGTALYCPRRFESRGIQLRFLSPSPLTYSQFGQPCVPHLSILDFLMFEPLSRIQRYLREGYTLI